MNLDDFRRQNVAKAQKATKLILPLDLLELMGIDVNKLVWVGQTATVITLGGKFQLWRDVRQGVYWADDAHIAMNAIIGNWLRDKARIELAPSDAVFDNLREAIENEMKAPDVPDSVGSTIKL